MELTQEMIDALIRGIRIQKSNRLRKERKLFKEGLEALDWVGNYVFIDSCYVEETITLYDKDTFMLLNKRYDEIKQNMNDYSYDLDIKFYSDHDFEGYDTQEKEPFAEISYREFRFPTLKQIKSNIDATVKNVVRDAVFKFEHQPNSNDVKRYLSIIKGGDVK